MSRDNYFYTFSECHFLWCSDADCLGGELVCPACFCASTNMYGFIHSPLSAPWSKRELSFFLIEFAY